MAVEGSHLLENPPKLSGKAWGRVGKLLMCKSNYPVSVFFILGNECCERFSFYGLKAILVIYLTQWLHFEDDLATALFHTFTMLCYMTPVLGAILSDGYLGKFKTILYLSVVYAIGNILMALTALPPPEWFGPMVALLLIALGTGGIKPCVAAFGGDQFSSDQTKELATFFSIFYFSINLGSVLSMLLTPVLRSDVKCFGGDCYPVAFGVPAALMIISLVVFLLGRSRYKVYPPTGNVIGRMCSCIGRAIGNRLFHRTESKDHWLDYANDTFEQPFIEDVKAVMHVLLLFMPLPIFWTLFDQQGSRWTLQAVKMNGSMGALGYLRPDQMQALNAILIIVLIPVFESIVYPLLDKCKIPNRPIQRMCFGMLLAASSFVVAGFVDFHIQAAAPNPLTMDQSSVQIINAAPCAVTVRAPFLNASLGVAEGYEPLRVPPGVYELNFDVAEGNESRCEDLSLGMNTDLRLVTQPLISYHVLLLDYGQSLTARQFNHTSLAPKRGGGLVSIVYAVEALSEQDQVVLRDGTLSYVFNLTELEQTPFLEVAAGRYEVHIPFNSSDNDVLTNKLLVDSGGVYCVVIQLNVSNHRTFQMADYQVAPPNKVPMWHQVPQYVLITAGEILFSVTGLSFAYTQAPASMKSVLQAAWLLTVGVGNLIVIIAAESRLIDNQAVEFLVFAGLMVVDTGVFALMGYFYVYIKQERDYDELGGDQDTLVSEAESHALDDKTAAESATEEAPSATPTPSQ